MGRPAFNPSPSQRRRVTRLAAEGQPLRVIAEAIGTTRLTLAKRCSTEILAGRRQWRTPPEETLPMLAADVLTPTIWQSPLEYLAALFNDATASPERRDRAAIAALPYCHARAVALGKKEIAQRAAEAVGGEWGELLPDAPPSRHSLGSRKAN